MADVEDKPIGVQELLKDLERQGTTSGSNVKAGQADVDTARVEKVYK
jgi:hypothetical protein